MSPRYGITTIRHEGSLPKTFIIYTKPFGMLLLIQHPEHYISVPKVPYQKHTSPYEILRDTFLRSTNVPKACFVRFRTLPLILRNIFLDVGFPKPWGRFIHETPNSILRHSFASHGSHASNCLWRILFPRKQVKQAPGCLEKLLSLLFKFIRGYHPFRFCNG